MDAAANDTTPHAHLLRWATYAATATALVLMTVKVVAWLMTDSVSLLSSTVDSLLDGGASLVNLFAVRQSLQPADSDHRFGHGKAEPLAGLAQAAFVAGSGILLLVQSVGRLLSPTEVKQGLVGIGVMVFAIIATFALVSFQKYVIRRTSSVAIAADSLHYTGDLLINGSVIVSIGLTMALGWTWLDPVFAIAIAAFLVWNAWTIAKDSFDLLMDKELPEEDRKTIAQIALKNPQVKNVHDLRTRSSGPQQFIQLHLTMDGAMPLFCAHAVGDDVEQAIQAAFPAAEVIIHHDPAGLSEPAASEVYLSPPPPSPPQSQD